MPKQSQVISPNIIEGDNHSDERGILSFANNFDMLPVKRMYLIQHPNTTVVRAWQGHQKEDKYFYVTQGSFKIAAVKIDDWQHPSPNLIPEEFILNANKSQVLHIPKGHANGFKALEPNSKLIVFSNLYLEEAKLDDFRFDSCLWINWKN